MRDASTAGRQTDRSAILGRSRAIVTLFAPLAVALCCLLPGVAQASARRVSARRGAASALKVRPRLAAPCVRVADRCQAAKRLLGPRLGTATHPRGRHVRRAAARPALGGTGSIEGTVTDAASKAGLGGVEVCAYDIEEVEEQEPEAACTETAESGKYALGGLAAGEYVVEFFDLSRNFITQYYNGKSVTQAPNPVLVHTGVSTTAINAAMAEGGRVEGQVLAAATKAPLEGVLACALGATSFECAETGPEGKYLIKGLSSGSYSVVFLVPRVPGENFLRGGKEHVSVKVKETTKNVNAELLAGGEIDGTVTAAAGGAPLAHAEVCAFTATEEVEECTETGADGTYTIERLPTGSYDIEFFAPTYRVQFYSGGSDLSEATAVNVVAGNAAVAGIDAQMPPGGGVIEGLVTSAATSAPLDEVEVCAIAPPHVEVRCTLTEPDGTYALTELPSGSYKVEFYDPPDYLTQFYDGASELAEATTVNVAAGGVPITGIDAAMQTGGFIEGRVTSAATSGPLGGVEVCAIAPPDAEVECALTEADGSYQIGGLPSGSYKVEFYDPPFFLTQFYAGKASLSEATAIFVGAGGALVTGIDAKMLSPQTQEPGPEQHSGGQPQQQTPPPGSGVLSTKIAVPSLTVSGRLHLTRATVTVKLTCTIGPCRGTLKLIGTVLRRHRVKGRTVTRHVNMLLGSGSFVLVQGSSGKAKIHLDPTGRRLLANAARHPHAAELKLTMQGAQASARAVVVG